MYLICFICLASYLKGILPVVLSSNVFTPYSLIRLARSTQIHSLKTVPSSLGLANNVQVNNKSQIVLLTENSTELNDNFALKEQYELQNETDILDRSNDTYTNITSLPEISSYMNSHFVLISGASLAGCVILLSFVILGYIMYKKSRWNTPQALDHCSNADSIGYLDDMFKENSDEMYSLDNDSFLNSLEAMTIQNYWTENVKHTKL
ncbi:uncharacterized protein LOC132940307 isoform X1 [Metopolophium dirhodum]|uniref:uncharacterized protein LOC132940307 isoform X1 n=1 Tax=Metopolophium dirhodum TaxID=44670 RepID=UPI00299043B4|nr:uncharacterized protein LOC132940307 isoform X1 [Metopolophium dirhodum]